MPRYHAVFQHNGSGGYCEFTADNDDAARAQAQEMTRHYGEVRRLARNADGPGNFTTELETP